MTFYSDMAATADELLKEFGMPAVLRAITGPAPDRPVIAAIVEYMPREKASQFANPVDRRVLISPIDPSTGKQMVLPPDSETDVLVPLKGPDANKRLPFTSKVKFYAPADIVVLYECTVRR